MHCGTTFVALALLLAPCFQSTAEPGAGDKRDPVLSERGDVPVNVEIGGQALLTLSL